MPSKRWDGITFRVPLTCTKAEVDFLESLGFTSRTKALRYCLEVELATAEGLDRESAVLAARERGACDHKTIIGRPPGPVVCGECLERM